MDENERKRLIEENIPLVHFVMNRIKGGFPDGMTEEDLYQEGCIGLIKAVDHYRKEKGPFSTYACHVIRGAMLDGAMRYQWVSKHRDVRRIQSDNPVILGLISEIIGDETKASEEDLPDSSIMEMADEQLNLYEAMDHLDPVERALIQDHYFEGWTFIRIARKKQMKYYSVLSFHSSAIHKLKKRLS